MAGRMYSIVDSTVIVDLGYIHTYIHGIDKLARSEKKKQGMASRRAVSARSCDASPSVPPRFD